MLLGVTAMTLGDIAGEDVGVGFLLIIGLIVTDNNDVILSADASNP